jgi:predicted RNase H-like nuclease (RuvC/YqgF family)
MDLELLDRLEDRVEACVSTVRDLRSENETLRAGAAALERKVESLTRDLQTRAASRDDVEKLRARCAELERKLARVRGRIEGMVERIKTLEG